MTGVVVYGLSFLLAVCFLILYMMKRKVSSVRTTFFFVLIINISATALVALISEYIEFRALPGTVFFVIQYISRFLYFAFHTMLAPLYWLYMMALSSHTISNSFTRKLLMIPWLISEVLVFLSPLFKCIFYFDENHTFQRGNLEIAVYIIALFYMILAVRAMVQCSETLSRKYIGFIWYLFTFIVVGVIVQALLPAFKVEIFCEVVALIGMMFSIEGEDGLLDSAVRAYNRRGFVADNRRLIELKNEYSIITINILNFRLYKRLLGYSAINDVMSNIVEWLHTILKKSTVYRVTASNIAIIVQSQDESLVNGFIAKIKDRFEEEFNYYGTKLDFNVNIAAIKVPNEFSESETILHLAEDYIVPETVGVKVLKSEDFNHLIRFAAIEAALKEAITKNRFMVNYQPIWNVEKKKFTSCEALVRLTDPKLGIIPPDEFIGVAERCALISDIGLIVFEKVCQAISSEAFKELGIEYVEVNLSVFQMTQEGLSLRFKEIMDKYGVTSDQINFEITESASFGSLLERSDELKTLRDMGFTFSLDDYGTGYSNLSFVARMDFLNIKSDKALLWDSANNEKSWIILEDTLRMIRTLDRNVIQEGVETKEQLDKVVGAGANYIQGYYFSKPLAFEEFVSFIKRSLRDYEKKNS